MPPPGPVVPFLLCSKAAAGEILRSLARRRRVPSSITTSRWPVTRLSSAGWGGRGEAWGASATVPAAAHRPGLPEVRFARASRAKCCGCTGAFQALRAGSIPVARSDSEHHGEWRSLVAHPAGGRAVAGSNPVSPIDKSPANAGLFFVGESTGTTAVWFQFGSNLPPRSAPTGVAVSGGRRVRPCRETASGSAAVRRRSARQARRTRARPGRARGRGGAAGPASARSG